MNREIKFRICYTDQNGAKYVFYGSDKFLITLNGEILENYGSKEKPMWEFPFDVESPPILQQFTGLKDGNGKEIYEGDIIEDKSQSTYYKNSLISEVKYNGCGFYASYLVALGDSINILYEDGFSRRNIRIIGNVFENPELSDETE